MAFMVPIVKKEWDIYGSASGSSNSNNNTRISGHSQQQQQQQQQQQRQHRAHGIQRRPVSAGGHVAIRRVPLRANSASAAAALRTSPSSDCWLLGSAPTSGSSRRHLGHSWTSGRESREPTPSVAVATASGGGGGVGPSGGGRRLVFGPRSPPPSPVSSPLSCHNPVHKLSSSVPGSVDLGISTTSLASAGGGGGGGGKSTNRVFDKLSRLWNRSGDRDSSRRA